jgi:hypothetical protein
VRQGRRVHPLPSRPRREGRLAAAVTIGRRAGPLSESAEPLPRPTPHWPRRPRPTRLWVGVQRDPGPAALRPPGGDPSLQERFVSHVTSRVKMKIAGEESQETRSGKKGGMRGCCGAKKMFLESLRNLAGGEIGPFGSICPIRGAMTDTRSCD